MFEKQILKICIIKKGYLYVFSTKLRFGIAFYRMQSLKIFHLIQSLIVKSLQDIHNSYFQKEYICL